MWRRQWWGYDWDWDGSAWHPPSFSFSLFFVVYSNVATRVNVLWDDHWPTVGSTVPFDLLVCVATTG